MTDVFLLEPTVSYTRGTDLSGSLEGAGGIGGLLARSSGYSSGNWTANNFYFADGNGNVTYMLNSSQGMVASYRYDPFGNTISSSGTLASANVYRFSSKEIHANSGMYYYGYRFYDPNLQRWINRDPIGERGGKNLYRIVSNNTINKHDRLGLAENPPFNSPFNPIFWPPNPVGNCNSAEMSAADANCRSRGLFLLSCNAFTEYTLLEEYNNGVEIYRKYQWQRFTQWFCIEPRACPPPHGGGGRRNDPPPLPPSGPQLSPGPWWTPPGGIPWVPR